MDPVVQVLIDRIEMRASDIGHLQMQLADKRQQLKLSEESCTERGEELERLHSRNAVLMQMLCRIARKRNRSEYEMRQAIVDAFRDLHEQLPIADVPDGKLPQ